MLPRARLRGRGERVRRCVAHWRSSRRGDDAINESASERGRADAHQTPAPPAGSSTPLRASLAGTKRVVAVASGKGGVGEEDAVNLACAAASALGLRVGLLDADVHGPSVPRS